MPTTYAIPDGRTVMAATLYTGNGTGQSISNDVNGVSFQPDFTWFKRRDAVTAHALANSVSGIKNVMASNLTDAEYTESALNGLISYDSDGFTVGTVGGFTAFNASGSSIVAWNWKAGGTAVTNTAGSITSQVSASPTAGFSVVTYTGNATIGATIGHGLGVAPSMVIVKRRDGVAIGWVVGHTSIGWTNQLELNSTIASTAYNGFNSTTPTSSVITTNNSGSINGSGFNYVAYCYAAVPGYSAFGSYTGNGSSNGPFVYLGFRPRFVMFKRTNSTGSWFMEDTSRGTFNVMGPELYANSSDSEGPVSRLDVLSNGFKMRAANAGDNASGGSYIYMAFAENPFKYANAR
tara:strand:- start:1390 stop:2436 length:1047 start_codon:yes stop_codon:yes gene_type:complete